MSQFSKEVTCESLITKKISIHNTPIPDTVSDCPECVYLSLKNNGTVELFRYTKFLSNFKKLKTLRISENMIQKIPSKIFELRELKILDLSYNKIENIDDSICLLENIVSLNLSNNCIFDLNSEIFKLPKLRFLFLSENQIKRVPNEIIQQKSLLALDIRDNPLEKDSTEFQLGFESLKSKLEDRVIVRDTELSRENVNRKLSKMMLKGISVLLVAVSALLFYILFKKATKLEEDTSK